MSSLLAVSAFLLVSAAVYLVAGLRLSGRARRERIRAERALSRAGRRAALLLRVALGATCAAVYLLKSRTGPIPSALLLYLLPLLWLWCSALGTSWLEINARGLDTGLWRYHRFNVFLAFLLGGQRLPFLSAALAAPSDLSRGVDLLPGLAAHFVAALALGVGLRWLVVERLVELRPFPDPTLLREVERVAVQNRIRLRAVVLVPTERGQSANAVAATSSRVVYVAEALYRGLSREEVRAVLLHELGHLGQHAANLFRDLAVLGVPAALWAVLAAIRAGEPLLGVGALALLLAGFWVARLVYHAAEHRADLFAERNGTRGALASALGELYVRDPRADGESDVRHPSLESRLKALEAEGRTSDRAPA